MTSHEIALLNHLIAQPQDIPIVAAELTPDDFSDSAGSEIYSALVGLHELGVKPDLITIVDFLKARNALDKIGGPSVVSDMIASGIGGDNIAYYSQKIREQAQRRKLKRLAVELSTAADGVQSVQDVIADFSVKLESVVQNRGPERLSVGDIAASYLQQIESGSSPRLFPLCIPALDALMGPLRGGEFVVIAARPSVGKTAFAINVSVLAAENGMKTVFFSIEMPRGQIFKRMLSLKTGLSMATLEQMCPEHPKFEDVVRATDALAEYPIVLCDEPAVNVNTILAVAKSIRDVDLIVVDYMQLMSGTKKHYDNRQHEVASISHGLKILARKLDIPVIALSQLNRNIELRGPGSRPILADLRESGAIEQDADRVIFLHRQTDDNEALFSSARETDQLLVSVAKNRNGPTGDVMLTFVRRTMRIAFEE